MMSSQSNGGGAAQAARRSSAPPHEGAWLSSVASLTGELAQESAALLRGELALARAETQESFVRVERTMAIAAGGAAVLGVGGLALATAFFFLLALVWPWWLSALVVGLVLTSLGVTILLAARYLIHKQELAPERTERSLRETEQMALNEVKRTMGRLP